MLKEYCAALVLREYCAALVLREYSAALVLREYSAALVLTDLLRSWGNVYRLNLYFFSATRTKCQV